MSTSGCQWIKADQTVCGASCKPNSSFCYTHAPLAAIGWQRTTPKVEQPKPFVVVGPPKGEQLDHKLDASQSGDTLEDQRRIWKQELDRQLGQFRKDKVLNRKDFPQLVDGLYFASIDEYQEYLQGKAFTEDMSRRNRKKKKDRGHGSYFSSAPAAYTEPKKQDERLKHGWYQRVDSIAHMRYIIYRDMAGWYYACFVSVWEKDTEKQSDALKTIVRAIAENQLPKTVPVQIAGVGQFHTSEPFFTFYGAESKFTNGGENLSRIRERMRKAADPKWIPPNLRKMAIAATYDAAVWELIPTPEHERLKQWLAEDCPGWYGSPPKGGYRTKGSSQSSGTGYSGSGQYLLPTTLPITATSQDFKKGSSPGTLVWDTKLNRWVKK